MRWLPSSISKIFFCGLALTSLLLISKHYTEATTGIPFWGVGAASPAVTVLDSNYQASVHAANYCHDQDFVLKIRRSPYYSAFEDQTYTQCGLYTAYGLLSTNGILQLNNTLQPYHIATPTISYNVVQVPNAKALFLGGGHLLAYDSPATNFELRPGNEYLGLGMQYEQEYYLKDGIVPRILKDSVGQTVRDLSHIQSSVNGKWLIAEKGKQLLRVRADNFDDLLTFHGEVRESNPFSDPNDDITITSDGRYVALAGGDGPNFQLYDLSTCVPDASYSLNNATNCEPVDMVDFLSSKLLVQVLNVTQPQFSNDGTQLSVRVLVQTPSGKRNELVLLTAHGAQVMPPTQIATDYIALGDSYASGEGAFNYFDGTDEGDNKCHLSKVSYPYLLGLRLHLDSAHSVACSGAKMVNMNGSGAEASQYTTKPLDAFSSDWLPGYAPQLQFIDEKQPNIVTVSMVGNDVGFADIIKRCILFDDTCYPSYEDRLGLVQNINSKFDSLVAMYTQIKAAAAPGAKVYVIGYPSIVKPDGNCGLNVHLNGEETEFASKLTNYLDYVIKLAAEKAGVTYVDAEEALDSFRLCDDVSAGISAVNGLTAGNDTLHLIGQESYHPTAFGHQLLADTIATLTGDMTEENPAPDWTIKGPDLSQATDFLNAPKTEQDIRKIEFEGADSPPLLLLPGDPIQGALQAYKYHLDSKTSYDFLLHSTTIKLGTVQSDQDGNLSYTFNIPQTIEPGWHILDILGNDITGQPVDIQRMIYVAASADDWDGDGIPNSQELCGLFDVSGVDTDKDGIDDACDGVISRPPIPTAPTVLITDPINAANQRHVAVSGAGEPGTTAHISIDDANPDTKAVTATAALPTASTATVDYTELLDVSSLDDGNLTVSVTLSNDNGTSPATTADAIKDTQPPQLSIAQDPASNGDGWNNQAVNLQLDASDAGTGVAELTYGATGAQPIATQSITVMSASFTISAEGKTIVTYTATDKAGNSTVAQTKAVNIDTEPPATSINQPTGPVLFGIFGNVLTGTTTDNLSGAATTQVTFGSTGHKKITTTLQAACVSGCGTAETTWQADTSHLPSGLYTITASSIDRAGNSGNATPQLRVVIVNFPWLWTP